MSWDREQLHNAAREIFASALSAVDAQAAVRKALKCDGNILRINEQQFQLHHRPIYSVAIGKAAHAMAAGLSSVLGNSLKQGVLTTQTSVQGHLDPQRWELFAGGHPVPNQESLNAAQAAFQLLKRANNERALIIFLISGGGSAMLEWPRTSDITLNHLVETNRLLVNCGASIAEINTVRRAFSAVKGGGLAHLASDCEQVTLIISDTNPGEEEMVASGPTIARRQHHSAAEIVSRYGLTKSLPASIRKSIESYQPAPFESTGTWQVLLDNQSALQAAAEKARELGFATKVDQEIREQPIEAGCNLLLDRLRELVKKGSGPICLISGGEFACKVSGDGVGGRNQETVLRCAIKLHEQSASAPVIVLSGGTDGIDGNSPASGAIGDDESVTRAQGLGLNAKDFLSRSDSFTFFEKLGDTIITGSTGTNVRDVRIIIAN